MGGSEEDESAFRPRGPKMENHDMQIELVKLRERLVAQRKDIDGQNDRIEDQEKRITSLEKKLIFASGLAAGGGGLIGGLASQFFGH